MEKKKNVLTATGKRASNAVTAGMASVHVRHVTEPVNRDTSNLKSLTGILLKYKNRGAFIDIPTIIIKPCGV